MKKLASVLGQLVSGLIVILIAVAVFGGLFWFGFWSWSVNHPGAPWWGFFLR